MIFYYKFSQYRIKRKWTYYFTLEDILVYAEDNKYTLAICITNKRLLLFQDINRFDFRYWPIIMSSYKPKYEMVYELDKNKIKKIEFKDNINYLKTENNYILKIYCENLEKYLLIK